MQKRYEPVTLKCKHMLHGADYNPEQWLDREDILKEDIRLMKLAKCNVVSMGMFSWSSLEPEEGKFNFEWLDKIMDALYENRIYTILSTPSGARPNWLSKKYPEVLRVNENRIKNLFGERHNHCYTSPIYREKVRIINTKLAERYKNHPGLIMWHVSNEYEGNCHCPLCQEAFRNWLKKRYDGDLNKLNKAWWTTFWSHTYTDWSQIESPSSIGEMNLHGLNIDWRRFVTYQTLDFFKDEIKPLKKISPNIPVTTNFHDYINIYNGIDYWRFAPYLDVISWDNYPYWHVCKSDVFEASKRAFIHDINRSLKNGKPFMMMESSPSSTNWQPIAKLRRPGVHKLASIQAIAHGCDTVQYFQWRKSRGSSEKFHGAVVDHCGHENTRVFKDVQSVGDALLKMDSIIGTSVNAEVAVIYDWENDWAIEDSQGPRQEKKDYFKTCVTHYKAFWEMGVPVDVINMEVDFSKYKVIVAPMLYMIKNGVGQKIREFVKNGGIFITTYFSGIADDTDLCFLEGFPGEIKDVMGIWSEELDALCDEDINYVKFECDNKFNFKEKYEARVFCDLIHSEGAKILARYTDDFYAGMPAVTENIFGKGKAYYIAFRSSSDFLLDFYKKLIEDIDLTRAVNYDLPHGVTAQLRCDGELRFIFISNFNDKNQEVNLNGAEYIDIENGNKINGILKLNKYDVKILKEIHR